MFRKLIGASLAGSQMSIDDRQGLLAKLVLEVQFQLVLKNMLGLLGNGHEELVRAI